MARYDFVSPRLFVEADLHRGASLPLAPGAHNYLVSVLRLGSAATILAFNGRDGEWRATLRLDGRKHASLEAAEQVRPQPPASDLLYLFAPLKHARLDYMVQKAVEMGAGALQPVRTARTVPARVNGERMRLNAIEAAEQCGILAVPAIHPEQPFAAAIRSLASDRTLVFCDEDAPDANPVAALSRVAAGPLAVLVGPEGGFAPEERTLLQARPRVVRISLGPRILRADTAAVAALALVQATRGDWT